MSTTFNFSETIKQLQRIWNEIGSEDMLGRKAINDAIMHLDYLEALAREGRIKERE